MFVTYYLESNSAMARLAKILISLSEEKKKSKNFLWASWLWVDRRKVPILGHIPKNGEKRIEAVKG